MFIIFYYLYLQFCYKDIKKLYKLFFFSDFFFDFSMDGCVDSGFLLLFQLDISSMRDGAVRIMGYNVELDAFASIAEEQKSAGHTVNNQVKGVETAEMP